MIREWLESYFTPASSEARRLGFVYEAVAFESRGKRLAREWQSHWSKCHAEILKWSSQFPEVESLTILGSGCLFEIPKPWMVQRFKKVFFVDQVFPRSVRKWVGVNSSQTSFHLVEKDILKLKIDDETLKSDLLLSANILSQLALGELRSRSTSDETSVRRGVEMKHLELLSNRPLPSLLWTDTQRDYYSKEGEKIESDLSVLTPLPKPDESWIWHLAPLKEESPLYSVELKMGSWSFGGKKSN